MEEGEVTAVRPLLPVGTTSLNFRYRPFADCDGFGKQPLNQRLNHVISPIVSAVHSGNRGCLLLFATRLQAYAERLKP